LKDVSPNSHIDNSETRGRGSEKHTIRRLIVLSAVVAACLAPFSGKAFHMDDPLFIWIARRILESPLDFYGFSVNWYSGVNPMHVVMQNPPGASYFIALVASVAGWSERAIHLGFLLAALGVASGTYLIAVRFTRRPFLAALLVVFTPVFMVSATTVMSDMLMLALWCWAVVFWLRGSERQNHTSLFFSALLVSLALLTKYFAVVLVPLLLVRTLTHGRRGVYRAAWLLLPVVVVVLYQWGTLALYGRGLFFSAGRYSISGLTVLAASPADAIIGFIFTGGCLITALFLAPLLWSRRALCIWAATTVAAAALLLAVGTLDRVELTGEGIRWGVLAQAVLFAVGGASLLCIGFSDLLRKRDPDSLFLLLWLAGTFVFAGFLNWTVNARSVLPMAPAAGILIARRLEQGRGAADAAGPWLAIPLVAALVVSLAVTWADYTSAGASRRGAGDIYRKYAQEGSDVWFQGHWGFQFYMEERGARPIEINRSRIKRGDRVIVPFNNTNVYYDVLSTLPMVCNYDLVYYPSLYLSTVARPSGAGFYSSLWGPLPYAIGPRFEVSYKVCTATDDMDMAVYWRLYRLRQAGLRP